MIPPATYVEFLLVFLGPPIAVLAALVAVGDDDRSLAVPPVAIGVIVLLALAYTIPWDNYLIVRGVWWYGDGSVAGTIWHAPVGEYAFIVLQPVVTALWLRFVGSVDLGDDPSVARLAIGRDCRLAGALLAAAVGIAGGVLLFGGSTLYLGAILAWAAPILAIQWAFGWPQLWRRRRTVLIGIAAPTAYLCAADLVAIRAGIWQLSVRQTTGFSLAGLPIEEATFFLVTNAFVVQGLVLYLWLVEQWPTVEADVRAAVPPALAASLPTCERAVTTDGEPDDRGRRP